MLSLLNTLVCHLILRGVPMISCPVLLRLTIIIETSQAAVFLFAELPIRAPTTVPLPAGL